MKTVLVLAAFVAIAVAAPAGDSVPAKPIGFLSHDEEQDGFGQFALSWESENGIKTTRQGSLKPIGEKGELVLVQSGSESWTSPDGTKFFLSWFADEDGFHASGDHLPTTPAAPVAPAA